MFRFKTLAAAATALFAVTGVSHAATVTVRDNADNGGSVFASGLNRTIDIVYNGSSRRASAGVFSLEFGSDADGWTEFLTFCLQLDKTLSLPRAHDRVEGAGYFADADDAAAMGSFYTLFLDGMLGVTDGTTAAAAQAIVWEIAEDGATSFDLTTGDFRVLTASVAAAANDMWTMIMDGVDSALSFDVFVTERSQDLLVRQVPLPGAAFLLISGVFGLGFASRKPKAI